jgi:hypothetical protein
MEHALGVSCGKQNAKQKKEQAIGDHAGKPGEDQAGECEE